MNEENPIKDDKIAENPGLLPYAHSAGGAVIRPEDEGKIKGKAVQAMRQQTDRQMGQLKGQMQTLVEQAYQIKRRIEVSERIYSATMNFEPHIGQTLFMYERHDGTDLLSLVAPHEWGRSFKYRRFVARVTLLYDHTWDVDFNEEIEFVEEEK